MKTFKIVLAAFIVAVAGLTVHASTKNTAPVATGWFKLMDADHPELASSYQYVGESQPCEGRESLCAIKGSIDPATIDQPNQSDVNAAKSASGNFTSPVSNLVAFEN